MMGFGQQDGGKSRRISHCKTYTYRYNEVCMITMTTQAQKQKQTVFAVVETGGKQYFVQEGSELRVEKLAKPSEAAVFSKVLLWSDGKNTRVGTPYLDDVKVGAERLGEGRGKKVLIIRFHSKTRYRKKKGHRQSYTKIRVSSIANGKISTKTSA